MKNTDRGQTEDLNVTWTVAGENETFVIFQKRGEILRAAQCTLSGHNIRMSRSGMYNLRPVGPLGPYFLASEPIIIFCNNRLLSYLFSILK
jgi:hypothetical protein